MLAAILIGGKGLRLRPLTALRPKAMVPLLGRPFLAVQLELLRRAGITEVVLCLGAAASPIRAHFGDGSRFGGRLHYAAEKTPLGTGGGLGNSRQRLREPFVCLNGDVLTDLDVRQLVRAHEAQGALLTFALARVPNPDDYGRIRTKTTAAGVLTVTGFEEKTTGGGPGPGDINAGAYVMDPAVFRWIPEGRPVSLEREVFPRMIAEGARVAALRHPGYFADIGVPGRYYQAHVDALDGRLRVPGTPAAERRRMNVDRTASVAPDAQLIGPSFVGPDTVVEAKARLGPYAVLEERVRVGPGVRISRSVLLSESRVEEGARITRSILGKGSLVGRGAQVQSAVLGDGARVPNYSRIPWQEP